MSEKGIVKIYNQNKGFGFITAADGSDVFLHIKSCVDEGVPMRGDEVTYNVTESQLKPGMMQADNVTGGTGVKGDGKGAAIRSGPPTGAYQGTCKSFANEKGYGFIIGSDGSDIFFHVKEVVDGSTPKGGDTLQFDLVDCKMKPGQVEAKNITGGTGWAAPAKGDGGGKGYGKSDKGWGKGDDSWGPYGGKDGGKDGKGKGKGKDKGAMMEAMMAMMWGGGGWGADSWSGGGDSWSGKGDGWSGKGDGWSGKGGW